MTLQEEERPPKVWEVDGAIPNSFACPEPVGYVCHVCKRSYQAWWQYYRHMKNPLAHLPTSVRDIGV